MEASHEVVQYSWVQKTWELIDDHYFEFIHDTKIYTLIVKLYM